ncbi:hypothetical protein CLG_B0698 [Clostridium botulinum D str. 1873]|uniref:Uncharacterized protein n=1 Tax=Clostridium botulinum D str. 1873 TaxID=592027 RepID=A0A9P2LLR9_CLOBO|nr:hypothetical protein CLG_B0698 [Clostridium botulinum D str. 1873]
MIFMIQKVGVMEFNRKIYETTIALLENKSMFYKFIIT